MDIQVMDNMAHKSTSYSLLTMGEEMSKLSKIHSQEDNNTAGHKEDGKAGCSEPRPPLCLLPPSADHFFTIPGSDSTKPVALSKLSGVLKTKRSRTASDRDATVSPIKRIKSVSKDPSLIVKTKEINAYFRLLEDPCVNDFLMSDQCKLVTDKYLLAMVFAYFKRATFTIREYSKVNFFLALYLASDMEEDEEEYKYEIFPWALGKNWKKRYMNFLRRREKLWARINFKAVVSRKCCEEIMALEPTHWSWTRERGEHHGGAVRNYARDPDDDGYPRGPDGTPRVCMQCNRKLEYDSASPCSTSWYLSSSAESSPDDNMCPVHSKTLKFVTNSSRFDMKGLKQTLQEDEGIWACNEEE